ncbi:MAG: hypothetical protein WA208_16540, partial [Thermoanaerobaculia bacterium]
MSSRKPTRNFDAIRMTYSAPGAEKEKIRQRATPKKKPEVPLSCEYDHLPYVRETLGPESEFSVDDGGQRTGSSSVPRSLGPSGDDGENARPSHESQASAPHSPRNSEEPRGTPRTSGT